MSHSAESPGSLESMRSRRDASARLARPLDRAVVIARAGRLLDLVGRLVCAAILAILAVLLTRAVGLGLPFPAGPIAVATAIGIAGWQASRRWKWPDRLATAMAIERAHPRIGEKISRAVAFINASCEKPVSQMDLPGVSLMTEALDEATAALEGVAIDRSGRHPLRGPLIPLEWPTAGLASAVAFSIAMLVAPGRLVQPLADAFLPPRTVQEISRVPPVEPASRFPIGAVAAASRLAGAAATEERLAAALLARFARSPGVARDELSRGEQDWLDEIASLQAVIAEDVGRDLSAVVAAVEGREPTLAAKLAGGLVRERVARLARAADRIRGNQLAAASGLIMGEMRPLLVALAEWGVEPTRKAGPAFDRAELVQRRIMSAIGGARERATGAFDAEGRTPAAGETELAPVDAAVKPSATATAGIDSAGDAAGGTTGDAGGPGSGAAPADGGVVTAPGDRLPAWVRAREQRSAETLSGDPFAAPPRYREAVNDYYLRLWTSESPAEIGESTREAAP